MKNRVLRWSRGQVLELSCLGPDANSATCLPSGPRRASYNFYDFFFSMLLGISPRVSRMLGKHSSTESYNSIFLSIKVNNDME